ncbi:STM4012 family radical SAM protein [Saccharibacillus sp. CPCC 101409]|uniref:STM4012 family radical SAM protein n=1 Tax=Saccharibacillus sp. CPCC 101409 TaxID=3058041 RepID=UPI002670D3ED|nr:STM4012 family radical SAM protein [Saccharibacillus sp. CPCC 101409]MDO3409556.1 STM4012 family radical SAM protein [Saccharibacillus sp. CPCC 101409]
MTETTVYDAERVQAWKRELAAAPYRSYLYSYPHKTAYRTFDRPKRLEDLWKNEPAETFFLYMHIPFCGARCGFCNLFTLPDKREDVHERYVDALERQARQWAKFAVKPFARFAIGGGTPTLLRADQLSRLFDIAENIMGLNPDLASISVETSPETIDRGRLNVLKERGVDRVSMGIQSFIEAEASAIYRPQKPDEVRRALGLLTEYDFPLLNLDLIYGLPGQTLDSWLYSLDEALSWEPGEIFLYPLYTREHTILKPGDIASRGEDIRMLFYLAACERLEARGYEQFSMRRFARRAPESAAVKRPLDYGCQEEGMMGLGCGARSYTQHVHYASRYGVSRRATESIIADYVAAEDYGGADYGFELSADELRRRFVLKGLLHSEGLTLSEYRGRFGTDAFDDLPELNLLTESGLAAPDGGVLRMGREGLGYSDAIGDWLISDPVRGLMREFVLP